MSRRALVLYNGRGQERREADKWVRTGHVFLAAYSNNGAVRLMKSVGFRDFTMHELKTYFSRGCWGDRMKGITPEEGVWAFENDRDSWDSSKTPVRLRVTLSFPDKPMIYEPRRRQTN